MHLDQFYLKSLLAATGLVSVLYLSFPFGLFKAILKGKNEIKILFKINRRYHLELKERKGERQGKSIGMQTYHKKISPETTRDTKIQNDLSALQLNFDSK